MGKYKPKKKKPLTKAKRKEAARLRAERAQKRREYLEEIKKLEEKLREDLPPEEKKAIQKRIEFLSFQVAQLEAAIKGKKYI